MSSFHYIKHTPWTKVSLDNSLLEQSYLGQKSLGQLSPWTIVPWTIVATSFVTLRFRITIQHGGPSSKVCHYHPLIISPLPLGGSPNKLSNYRMDTVKCYIRELVVRAQ